MAGLKPKRKIRTSKKQQNCEYTLGELFCGPGGMAIAAASGIAVDSPDGKIHYTLRHGWGVDFASYAIDTFKANLGEENGICMDAWKFVREELSEARRINALAFGFPCNSFSSVGKRRGILDSKFGKLYQTGITVLERYNPDWFIAENVSGISKMPKKDNPMPGDSQFKIILNELANAGKGYNVVAHLYKFEEYGVPQARHRYVIVGIRSDIAKERGIVFMPPAPDHGPGRKYPFKTCKMALDGIKNESAWGGRKSRQSATVVERLKFTSPGQNAWKLNALVEPTQYPDEKLDEYLKAIPWYDQDIAPMFPITDLHERMGMIRAHIEKIRLHCEKAKMSHIYRRLDPNRPAYTLTGSGGGGTHIYHYAEHRALTNEERAALQSFPPDFAFKGSPEQVRKQIGMAVPTEGAKRIFEAILKTFAGEPYEHVEPNPDLVIQPTREV